ncbi:hypothetical protein J4P02_09480 [Pseudomonas sp. NFXW11]|uniref:hypothetical protein n=1 Tax=Pseudomonas sp. NFXW11 TaxID=2819531 RepID=UPI003CF7B166
MLKVQLSALALAGLLSGAAQADTSDPTAPVEGPKSPALQGLPKININSPAMDEGSLPPSTGSDPRTQGNDSGRQGGAGTLEIGTPDSSKQGSNLKSGSGASGATGNQP